MKSSLVHRTGGSLGIAAAVAIFAALPSASNVHAQGLNVVTITCAVGTETSQYSPGITNTTQNVRFTVNETVSCVDSADLSLTGGSETSSAIEANSCTGNAVVGPYETTFYWDNGEQSVVNITQTIITKLANGQTQSERTGTVLSGPGAGGTFTQTITTTNLDVTACSTPQGLISNSGVSVTSIVATGLTL